MRIENWRAIINEVLKRKSHEDIVIPKNTVPNPKLAGFVETIGDDHGQDADYELTLSDGRRIHVREHKEYYKAHWDKVSPLINPIEHLGRDAPHWWKISLSVLGGIIGYLQTKKMEDAIALAVFGYFIGVLTAEE